MSWVEEIEDKPVEVKNESFSIQFAGETINVPAYSPRKMCTEDLIWTYGLWRRNPSRVSSWIKEKAMQLTNVGLGRVVPRIKIEILLRKNKKTTTPELAQQT